jgi:maltose phosphorylase
MKPYLIHDEWCIIEEGFKPDMHKSSESIFSLGNGKMGQRANFEEHYSGPTLRGSYVAGIYYPDKTRVGWWKNGYPEYFAKVLNSPNYIGINVWADGEMLDLYTCKTSKFRRVLNMQEGTLTRTFEATLPSGKTLKVDAIRFLSMFDTENAAIRYAVTPVNFSGKITFEPYIDGDVENEDSNYDEKFWNILSTEATQGEACLLGQTKKLDFRVAFAMTYSLQIDSANATAKADISKTGHRAGNSTTLPVNAGQTAVIYKYAAVCSNLNHSPDKLTEAAKASAKTAMGKGFDAMLAAHKQKWADKWKHSDIRIAGDVAAQQGIRFNIFHLNQTYTGEDARLNIGPKGFTGEKYGGSTYWDTEAYCIPFYVSTAPKEVTRQLLVYRHKQLQKAIENAQKLGFTNGAALYPMVTMNGEECHNEWEITFEEIHRNGAIAFAIHNYIRHTGDYQYLEDHGLDVLIGIARFWGQRATWSGQKKKYVILGVTGPNEYENNINNNWYTNKFAVWCLNYAATCIETVRKHNPNRLNEILKALNFNSDHELKHWADIASHMHFPFDEELNVFMQQDNYLDKEQIMAKDLDPKQRPINQHWSWDRILRSCFIKQADTLQGIYVFEDEFHMDTIRRNFEFYEPRTVHESSLSPCVHSILAAKIGNIDKAYEMYLRTSRLDIDDYNHEVHEGLHITSMAGTWMAVVEGFGGKRVYDQKLYLNPIIPEQWSEYAFKITFMGNDIEVRVSHTQVEIIPHCKNEFSLFVYGKEVIVKSNSPVTVGR